MPGLCTMCGSTSNNTGRSWLSVNELRNARQVAESAHLSGIHPNHHEKSAAAYILSSLYDENWQVADVLQFLYKLILAKAYLLVSFLCCGKEYSTLYGLTPYVGHVLRPHIWTSEVIMMFIWQKVYTISVACSQWNAKPLTFERFKLLWGFTLP